MDLLSSTTEYFPFETTTDMPLSEIIASSSHILNSVLEDSSSFSSDDHNLHHNQITFEIPSHRDLEHIDTLHTFNKLLQRIGNVAYDTVATPPHHNYNSLPLAVDASGHAITSEQVAKSVVLDLAELRDVSSWDRFFGGADMHSIINYLWIGVVAALVVLSVVFILFSCYFYRKFREWKKCNKQMRSQLNTTGMYCGTHTPSSLDASAAYYQIENPPCYTIATGLPTYDEALHHHQQHFSFGMKFMYPNIAAVHPAMLAAGNSVACGGKQNIYAQSSKVLKRQQQQKDAAAMQALLSNSMSDKTEMSVASEATAALATMTSSALSDKAEEACLNAVIVA